MRRALLRFVVPRHTQIGALSGGAWAPVCTASATQLGCPRAFFFTRGGGSSTSVGSDDSKGKSKKDVAATAAAGVAGVAAAAATATPTARPTGSVMRAMFRKRQPSGATAKPKPKTATGGATSEEAETADAMPVGQVLLGENQAELSKAYAQFAKSCGACSEAELLQGGQQVYYSAGVVIGRLVEAIQAPGGIDAARKAAAAKKVVKFEEVAGDVCGVLGREFLPEKEWNMAPLSQAVAKSATNMSSLAVARVVSGLTSVLPMSWHLSEAIFKAWCMQKEGKANLLSIASSSDYIVESRLAIFTTTENPEKIFVGDNVGADIDVVIVRKDTSAAAQQAASSSSSHHSSSSSGSSSNNDADGAPATTRFKVTSAIPTHKSAAMTPTTANMEEKKEGQDATSGKNDVDISDNDTSSSSASSATEEAAAVIGKGHAISLIVAAAAAVPPPPLEDPAMYVKINGMPLPPIPASAHAFVMLSLDVAVPPGRYVSNYEWYYHRIVGNSSEYEKMAAARLFAVHTPKWIVAGFDFIMRMFTGGPLQLMFTKEIGELVGIPKDVSERPPTVRKFMCLYMDKSKRWILADLVPAPPIFYTKFPNTN